MTRSCDSQPAPLLMQERVTGRLTDFQGYGSAKKPSWSITCGRERLVFQRDSCTLHCLVQRVSFGWIHQRYPSGEGLLECQ